MNTRKTDSLEIESVLRLQNILYSPIGIIPGAYILDSQHTQKDLWNLDIYKQWKIYIQWISSQMPVQFFSTEKKSLKILDACAAPWGKTSQLVARFPDAEIWAFEPQKIRYEKLTYNLEKLWCSHVKTVYDSVENISKYITMDDSSSNIQWELLEYFDMILVDAPCSGEGTLSYHDTKFLANWSLTHIKKNYARQKSICDAILPYLKTGGEMIYSTCTIAPEENEAVLHYLLCKYKNLELQKIDLWENKYIKYKKALSSFWKNIFRKEIAEWTLRVIPSEFSEWFYIAKIRKCDFKE